MSSPITPQQCDDIETRARAATPGPWQANHPAGFITAHGQTIAVFGGSAQDQADADFIAHAPEDVDALLATVRHLTDRITELEGPAVYARAALAALCYDLEDPGANALGALYEISRVTSGVDAPKDEASAVIASNDATVMRRCAEFVRDTYSGDWADDAAATLERDADVLERGCPGYEKEYQGVSDAKRRLANCKHCGKPRATHAPTPV
jgi:hypothetical protein